jgi:hypothetical protein
VIDERFGQIVIDVVYPFNFSRLDRPLPDCLLRENIQQAGFNLGPKREPFACNGLKRRNRQFEIVLRQIRNRFPFVVNFGYFQLEPPSGRSGRLI